MKVITAQVEDGKVQLPPDVLDGTIVAILAPDVAGFRLSTEEEEELSAALAEIRAGDFVDGQALLAELKGSRPA